ncbi:MAG: SEC-C domain-containing protein [Oscillospiraceae bacterium]|nr:SEC-C domain-containing protein [Oscillospiraceae bacterium]
MKDTENSVFGESEFAEDIRDILRQYNEDRAVKGEPRRSLGDTLAAQSAASLRKLASAHKLRGYTKLNKEALIGELTARLTDPERLRDVFLTLHETEWSFFKKVSAAGELQRDDVFIASYRDLQDFGLVHTYLYGGHLYFVAPDEIRAVYDKVKKTDLSLERKYRWTMNLYAVAAANLYGVISLTDFAAIFNGQNKGQNKRRASVDEVFAVLLGYARLDSGYGIWNDYIVSDDLDLNDFDEVKARALEAASKPRYIPSGNEFLEYADWGYYEFTPQILALKRFMERSLKLRGSDADDIIDELHVMFKSKPEPDVPSMLSDAGIELSFSQTQEFLSLATDMSNNTRMWANNGYTPRELLRETEKGSVQRPAEKTPRVGRNDPCPCGSGKKYKKCCYLKENA